jgi:hypothetical protein
MDIKDRYTRIFLTAADRSFSDDDIKEQRPIWWWNVRKSNNSGLRLTQEAFDFIEKKAQIKTYKIKFPEEFEFTPQILIWLDDFIDSPYYITKKYIFVIKEKTAFELYLFSGDVKKLGYTKALARRLTQNTQ